MFFFKQFEAFDPVSGYVPSSPFPPMPAIAIRARALLKCGADYAWDWEGSKKRIISIAKRVNQELGQYFDDIKHSEIENLREQAGLLESMGGDPEWPPNEEDLEIQTWENTSEVDALKAVLEKRDTWPFSPLPPEFHKYSEGKDYEFFAVLSLWMLSDAMNWLNERQGNLSIAGEYALKAMDAVCYAEHLRDAEWLTTHTERLGDTKLAESLRKLNEESQSQKAALSRQLNVARHEKTYQAKAMVIEEFMRDRTQFPSAEKAGVHIADWLGDQGIRNSATGQPYEPRTVTKWILDHAKKIGLRFR